MRRLVAALLLAGLIGCAEDLPNASTPTPAVSAPVSAGDLSGKWVIGSDGEPGPGGVTDCQAPTQTMTLHQDGETLAGEVTVCGESCTTLEAFQGVARRGEVTLDGKFKGNQMKTGEEVHYELRYDAKTQHLVGTRDKQAFWAAPFVARPASACD